MREPILLLQLRLMHSIKALAFWGAVVLPFFYIPMLLTGLETTTNQLLFVAFVTLNVMLLIVGHSHRS